MNQAKFINQMISKKGIKFFIFYAFSLSIGFLIMALAWEYALYGTNEKPNYNNDIAFIVQFYISIVFFSFSIFFSLILIGIYLKKVK